MRSRLLGLSLALLLALAGAAVLVTYVRGIEARAEAGERSVAVLLVEQPVAEGTPAETLGDVVRRVEVPARVVADHAATDLGELQGQISVTDLQPGEQLLTTRFASADELAAQGQVDVPDDLHQVTVALEPQRAVGGALAPGDTVGVFISFDDADDSGDGTTHLTLHKVLVTRVQGDTLAADAGDGGEGTEQPTNEAVPAGQLLITLATPAADAERVVFAAEHGRLWLSHEPADAAEAGTQIQTKETIYR